MPYVKKESIPCIDRRPCKYRDGRGICSLSDGAVSQERSLSVVQGGRGKADEETGIIPRGNCRPIPQPEADREARSILHLLSGRGQAAMSGNEQYVVQRMRILQRKQGGADGSARETAARFGRRTAEAEA